VPEVDNEGRPAQRVDVERLDTLSAVNEVTGRIDVGSGVNTAAELADVGRVALRQEARLGERETGVSAPDGHPGSHQHADVERYDRPTGDLA
jgi:hypothetical protein